MEGLGGHDRSAVKVLVNGESKDLATTTTVAELLAAVGLPPGSVLVEHNGLTVPRHCFAETRLAEGDKIEILRMVAGG